MAGREPAKEFIDALDTLDGVVVTERIRRAENGNFGDYKRVGRVFELRIHHGPGYRVYYSLEGDDTIILLLVVGDKGSQSSDIEDAQQYLDDYRLRTGKAETKKPAKSEDKSKPKAKPKKRKNRKR